MTNWRDAYTLCGDDFEFCEVKSKKACPLCENCLRSVKTPISSEYWVRNGKYDKEKKQCDRFIPIEKEANE